MSYASNLQIINRTGLGIKVIDENVGTGDNTETSFDLDNDNIISGSYTLSYAASGSNDFTDLTETTHYTLDKASGRILLTTAGKTALSTNVLYATYTYSPKITDSELTDMQNAIDEEVERMTGRLWGTPATQIEYFDGRESFTYPTTDRPFANDWDEPDVIQLQGNVTEINNVFFLSKGAIFQAVYSSDGGVYTDNTDEANSLTGTAFNVFAGTVANDDAIYFGSTYQFYGMTTRLATLGVDSGSLVVAWQYYNGSSWTAFTPTAQTTGADDFTASGRLTWDFISDWAKVSVNSSTSYYFIRAVATTADYSTAPTMMYIGLDNDSVIRKEISAANYDWDSTGRISLLHDRIPNGNRIVKVIYKEGETSTNPLIPELATLVGGIMAYAKVTGGSYDDETGFSMGRKSVSIGEVYVNVREVVNQFRSRISEIMRQLGERIDIEAI